MILDTAVESKKGKNTRYLILLIIFIVTTINYADRATLSIAGTEVAKELQLSAISMGCLLYTSPSPRDLSTSRMPSSA